MTPAPSRQGKRVRKGEEAGLRWARMGGQLGRSLRIGGLAEHPLPQAQLGGFRG